MRKVRVTDLGNYQTSAQEPLPFTAHVLWDIGTEIWVRSLSTEKEYEIYFGQYEEV